MTTRAYTVLGWLVWQGVRRVASRKPGKNRAKLGAAAVVALVLLGGIIAARSGDADE